MKPVFRILFLIRLASYFEAFELKDNCISFKSVCFHFQSEVILNQLLFKKVNKIESSFLFNQEHLYTTLVRVEKLKPLCYLRNAFLYRNFCLKPR